MGIVSEPGSWGKGFVTTGQGGASPEQGWTRGRWERQEGPGEQTHNCAMGLLFQRPLHKALESGNQIKGMGSIRRLRTEFLADRSGSRGSGSGRSTSPLRTVGCVMSGDGMSRRIARYRFSGTTGRAGQTGPSAPATQASARGRGGYPRPVRTTNASCFGSAVPHYSHALIEG
jgi:hypothetical protein